jgi:hypothetical protein
VRRDAAINRERLVTAAEQVFADRGPAATLGDVANAAAVWPTPRCSGITAELETASVCPVGRSV